MARMLGQKPRKPITSVSADQMAKDIEDQFRKRMDTAEALKMNKRIDDKQHRQMVLEATDQRRIAQLRLNQQRRKEKQAALQRPTSRPTSRPVKR